MINAFILCDLFENIINIIQQTEKEALNMVMYEEIHAESTYTT